MAHEFDAASTVRFGDTKMFHPAGLTGGFEDNLRFLPSSTLNPATGDTFIPVDIIEHDSYYLVKADLIGVRREDIDVVLKDSMLTITAYSRRRPPPNGARFLREERRHGRYVRSLRLGTQIDDKNLRVLYKDGMLELHLPKVDNLVPKRIPIEGV